MAEHSERERLFLAESDLRNHAKSLTLLFETTTRLEERMTMQEQAAIRREEHEKLVQLQLKHITAAVDGLSSNAKWLIGICLVPMVAGVVGSIWLFVAKGGLVIP